MAIADAPSIPADEHVYIGWVPSIADQEAPSLGTDLATITDLSCWFTPDGWTPALSESVASDPRLCSAQLFERPGTYTRSLDVVYIDQTNGGGETPLPNTAKETFVPNGEGFLVVRRGKLYDTALAEGDVVETIPVQHGRYSNLPPETNSVLKIGQKMFITGPVVEAEIVDGS